MIESEEQVESGDGEQGGYNNDNHSQSDNGRDKYNEWEDIVSKTIARARLKAACALNNAARKLASTFSTTEAACVSKDDIVAAITQGLSRPEQAALASNFTTRTTEPTKEEQAKRDRRTSAQKTVACYFGRIFAIAFGVEWGLRGNRGKRRTKGGV